MSNLGKRNECQLFTVVVGTPLVLEAAGFSIPYPMVLYISPGIGGTLTVEQRGSLDGAFHNIPLPLSSPGVFSAYDVVKLNGGAEALRITALLADGVIEAAQ